MAAYSVGALETFGKERLIMLEKENVIHSSTISGDSLQLAKNSINSYVEGQRRYDRDSLEQLSRSCHSVANLIKKEYIRNN